MLNLGVQRRLLIERELPKEQRHGGKKNVYDTIAGGQ
jgi:hypothetical protein